MPTGVGAGLRRRREERGITLRQIAAQTKISPGALEAIERDDLKRLPGGIFTRAFVRAYATELRLDPERTLTEFLAQFPAADADADAALVDDQSQNRQRLRAIAQGAIIVLPLVALIAWAVVAARARGPRPVATDSVVAALPDAPVPAVLDPKSVASSATAEAVPVVREPGTMRVVLTMRSDCWVSAMADSRPVVERLLRAGESVELRARQSVVFKAGDAGAVSLQINGEYGRILGRSGQVVTARIDSSNLHNFLATP